MHTYIQINKFTVGFSKLNMHYIFIKKFRQIKLFKRKVLKAVRIIKNIYSCSHLPNADIT